MKIAGRVLGRRSTKVVTLDREDGPVMLTVQALPLGFLESTVRERLPIPVAPRRYAMRHGRVLRDQNGTPVVEGNLEDAAFQEATRRITNLHGVACIHEGLKADPSVTWDAHQNGSWEAFYATIWEELKESGMTSGEILQISTEILTMSAGKQKDVEAAREGFLSDLPASVESGSSPSSPGGPNGTSPSEQ